MRVVMPLLRPERQRWLDELEALAQCMLDQAEAGDWESVVAVQGGFEGRLRQLCTASHGEAEAFPLMQGLQRLQTLIVRVETLAHSRRGQLGADLQRLRQHQGAVRLYNDAAGPHCGTGGPT